MYIRGLLGVGTFGMSVRRDTQFAWPSNLNSVFMVELEKNGESFVSASLDGRLDNVVIHRAALRDGRPTQIASFGSEGSRSLTSFDDGSCSSRFVKRSGAISGTAMRRAAQHLHGLAHRLASTRPIAFPTTARAASRARACCVQMSTSSETSLRYSGPSVASTRECRCDLIPVGCRH